MLSWLKAVKGVVPKTVPHVFASAKIAPATKAFVEHLVQERGVRYRTVEGYVSSVLNVARFAHEARVARTASQFEHLLAPIFFRHVGVIKRSADRLETLGTPPTQVIRTHQLLHFIGPVHLVPDSSMLRIPMPLPAAFLFPKASRAPFHLWLSLIVLIV